MENGMVISNNKSADFAERVFGQPGRTIGLLTKTDNNAMGKALAVENSSGYSKRNIVEIELDNTGGSELVLYIGSNACLAGYPALFALPAGCQDNGVITDQYGVGVKFTQGLGLMLNQGSYIKDFQVISDTDNAPQLRKPISVRRYFPNGNTELISYPAVSTFNMDDQRKNMMKDKDQVFFIDPLNGVEYEIAVDFKGSIVFEVLAMDLSSLMNELK